MSGKPSPTRQSCNELMHLLGFDYELRRDSVIWAARARRCPLCEAAPHRPCLNLSQRRKGAEVPTRWPHDERIDWDKLFTALKKKEASGG